MLPNFENRLKNESAELYFFENGKETGGRRVFAPASLVGLTLALPRSLGTSAAELTLFSERGEPLLRLPLSFVEWEGEREAYAALLEPPPAAVPLCFLSLALDTAFGRLFCTEREDGTLSFVAYPSPDTRIPLLLLESDEKKAPPVGGPLYCLPLSSACRMKREEAEALLSTLSSLGMGAVYLCPSPREGADGEGGDPSTPSPSVFLTLAREKGITVLGDLLLLLGVGEHPDLLFGGFCSPPSQNAPVEEEPRPAFWGLPLSLQEEGGSSLADICGEAGVVEHALRAGYGGLVVRAADCFGDSFLAAMRKTLAGAGEPLLLGGTETGSVAIAFGTRRRFFFGGELDAPLSYTLRDALLAYFLSRDIRPLAAYLRKTLPIMPPATLAATPNLLSDGAVGCFYEALAPLGEEREPVAAMAYLAAATLAGVPAYYAGEEEAWEGGVALLRRLALLRKKEPTYAQASFSLLHLTPTLLVFLRKGEGEGLLTVLNPSGEPLTVSSPDGFFVVFGGRGRKQRFTLRPRGGAVLKIPLWEGESCRLHFSHT